tara:strand:- start:1051 stop:1359 length:309 start_codon:yes stop_codon:yes gene_type:complete
MNMDTAAVAERPINKGKVRDVARMLGTSVQSIYRKIGADHLAEGELDEDAMTRYRKQFPPGRLLPGNKNNTYIVDWDAAVNWKNNGDGMFGQHTPEPTEEAA